MLITDQIPGLNGNAFLCAHHYLISGKGAAVLLLSHQLLKGNCMIESRKIVEETFNGLEALLPTVKFGAHRKLTHNNWIQLEVPLFADMVFV